MLYIIIELFKSLFMFGSYSNNIFPDPLSKEDEEKYIQRLFMGDKEARSILIEHNLRLVAHIVKKYDTRKEDVDDLISIGSIGLIKGIDSFSNEKGTRITTYCARCIENEILMYFRSNKKNNRNISIDEPIGFDKDGNEISFIDILKTPKPDFIEDIDIQDKIKMLNTYINILSKREKNIIIKRYGLDGNKPLTQKEIAANLKISRSYVSRIEKRALTKMLKEFIKSKMVSNQ